VGRRGVVCERRRHRSGDARVSFWTTHFFF
jgi:hypothetical protein